MIFTCKISIYKYRLFIIHCFQNIILDLYYRKDKVEMKNQFDITKLTFADMYKKLADFLKIGHELDGEDDDILAKKTKAQKVKPQKVKPQKGAGCGSKHYQIGGACTLCGAEGVTKATCPLNPQAKNKKYDAHNVSAGVKVVKKSPPSPRAVSSVAVVKTPKRKVVSVSRGCNPQTDAKYVKRPSPPYPANECCGQVMQGNDGNMYVSRADKNNVCRWYKQK